MYSEQPSEAKSSPEVMSTCPTLRSAVLAMVEDTLRDNISTGNQALFDSNVTSLVGDYCVPDAQPLHLITLDPVTCDMEVSRAYHSLIDLADELERMRSLLHSQFEQMLENQTYILNWTGPEVALFLYCHHHPIILQAIHMTDHLWKQWETDTQRLATIHNALNEEQQQFFAIKWNEVAHFAFTTENQQKVREWIATVVSTINQPFHQSTNQPINQSIDQNDDIASEPLTIDVIKSFLIRLAHAQHAYRFVSGSAVMAILACIEGAIIDFTRVFDYDNTSATSTGDLQQQMDSSVSVPILAFQRDAGSGTILMQPMGVANLAQLIKDGDVRVALNNNDDDDVDDEDDRPCVEVAFRLAKRVW